MTFNKLDINKTLDFGRMLGRMAYVSKADDKEKAIVKFGMTPITLIEKMDLDPHNMGGREFSRGFSLGLYDAAEEDGGMRA